MLCIKDEEKRKSIAESIKQLDFSLKVKNVTGEELLVQTEVPSDNSERTAHVCKGLCEMRNVDHVQIFIDPIQDPTPNPIQTSLAISCLPLIPMVASSLVTFFVIFIAIDQLETLFSAHPDSKLDGWGILKIAGIPSLITFLTHISFEWRKLVMIFQRFQKVSKTPKHITER